MVSMLVEKPVEPLESQLVGQRVDLKVASMELLSVVWSDWKLVD
jgi:hypothetical protein